MPCRSGVWREADVRGEAGRAAREVCDVQAGHCRVQPVSATAGEVLSPAMI
jgi:hypothetical protein